MTFGGKTTDVCAQEMSKCIQKNLQLRKLFLKKFYGSFIFSLVHTEVQFFPPPVNITIRVVTFCPTNVHHIYFFGAVSALMDP